MPKKKLKELKQSMNELDIIEKRNEIKELEARNIEIKNAIKNFEVKNAVEDLEEIKKLEEENKANSEKIIEITKELTEDKEDTAKEDNEEEGNPLMKNFLESNNSVKEFFETMKKAPKGEFKNAWDAKLKENGVTISDTALQLPRKIVESIETTLTRTNPVFKVFKVTHIGAMIVSSLFDSSDEANVHTVGEEKTEQAATLDLSTVQPQMIYKLQTISEYVKRLNLNYSELYNLIVAEMTQAIINKAVDLALLEGTANGSNGFISIDKEANNKKVKKITAESGKLTEAVEDAIDFVRPTQGRRYLIVTTAQRKALLAEIRTKAGAASFTIKNTDAEIAAQLGVDELIVYTGTKDIKATVLVQDAYHIDMQDLTRVDAFEWKTNSNAILIEALSVGHMEKLNGAAVITFP